jgi:hypothetical protein
MEEGHCTVPGVRADARISSELVTTIRAATRHMLHSCSWRVRSDHDRLKSMLYFGRFVPSRRDWSQQPAYALWPSRCGVGGVRASRRGSPCGACRPSARPVHIRETRGFSEYHASLRQERRGFLLGKAVDGGPDSSWRACAPSLLDSDSPVDRDGIRAPDHPSLVQPFAARGIDSRGRTVSLCVKPPLTLAAIDAARRGIAPAASFYATAIAAVRRSREPMGILCPKLGWKPTERRRAKETGEASPRAPPVRLR